MEESLYTLKCEAIMGLYSLEMLLYTIYDALYATTVLHYHTHTTITTHSPILKHGLSLPPSPRHPHPNHLPAHLYILHTITHLCQTNTVTDYCMRSRHLLGAPFCSKPDGLGECGGYCLSFTSLVEAFPQKKRSMEVPALREGAPWCSAIFMSESGET